MSDLLSTGDRVMVRDTPAMLQAGHSFTRGRVTGIVGGKVRIARDGGGLSTLAMVGVEPIHLGKLCSGCDEYPCVCAFLSSLTECSSCGFDAVVGDGHLCGDCEYDTMNREAASLRAKVARDEWLAHLASGADHLSLDRRNLLVFRHLTDARMNRQSLLAMDEHDEPTLADRWHAHAAELLDFGMDSFPDYEAQRDVERSAFLNS